MKKTVLLGVLLLFLFPYPGFSQTTNLCEGNFDCDGDVDGTDAAIFKEDFGRSPFSEACPPCGPATTTSTTSIPEPRFVDNGDGTVTDSDNDLVWLRNALCDELNNAGNGLNWYDATATVGSLASGSCGLTDGSSAGEWRLPTREEWEQFVCNHYTEPAICNTPGTGKWSQGDPFNNVQLFYYWTGTPVESSTDNAWTLFMDHGIALIGSNSSNNYTWPVRDSH